MKHNIRNLFSNWNQERHYDRLYEDDKGLQIKFADSYFRETKHAVNIK